MRIDYVARRPIPSKYANSVQIMRMCEAFARNGHDVRLFALPGEEPLEGVHERYGVEPSFAVERLPGARGPFYKARFFAQLARRAKGRADLYFGRDIYGLAMVARLGKPIIYEAHVIPPQGSFQWRALDWLVRRRNFARLVCVTSTLAELHREQFPALPGDRIMVAPNAAAEPAPAVGRAAFSAAPGRLQVGFVGRPFPGKGIEAMAAAAAALPALDFHVVGSTQAEVSWIEGELSPNLRFHGYKAPSELTPFYQAFDIAAAPYGREVSNASGIESAAITSPLKLLEYMAAGLPAIVSDLPGVHDITDEEAAIIIPAGDDRAFIAALERLSVDAELRSRLGKTARRRFLERHSTTARARAVLEGII